MGKKERQGLFWTLPILSIILLLVCLFQESPSEYGRSCQPGEEHQYCDGFRSRLTIEGLNYPFVVSLQ